MAFTTIAWDGTGVIANCDALSDTAGGSWAELGGGGISANTDNYLLPPASIGHVYASKSGFGYYTTAATYDFTPTTGTQDGEFIYIWIQIQSASAFDTLANNGFSIVVGTDTSNYRTYKIAGSGTGEGKPFDGGGWKLFVVDPTIAGSIADTGTFNIATINMIGLWMDTIVSVRADTIFIDQISLGKGLRVTGTGTLDEAVTYCTDYTNRAWGVFQKRGSIYFAYGGLVVGDSTSATVNTVFTDSGNVVEFGYTEFWNGTAWALTHPATYNKIVLDKHASYTTDYTSTNTSLFGSAGAELALTVDSGATRSLSGGQLKEMTSLVTVSGQTLDNKVMSTIDASTIGNIPVGCTWDTCGLITISAGGGLDSCVIYKGTGTSAVLTPIGDISDVTDCTFTSDGTGHGLEITGTATNITLTGTTFTNYASTDGSTGNEGVYVNIASGSMNLTISGGSTPSVRTAGASVTLVVGAVNVTAYSVDDSGSNVNDAIFHLEAAGTTMSPFPVGDTITIVNASTTATATHTAHGMATNDKVVIRGASLNENIGVFSITVTDANTYTYTMGSAPGSSPTGTITSTFVVLNGLPTGGTNTITMSRSFPSSQQVVGRVRKSSSAPYYKVAAISGTVSNTVDTTFTGVMISDD